LFRNSKRAARPILSTIEARLKERFPDYENTGYSFKPDAGIGENEEWISKFDERLKGIDARRRGDAPDYSKNRITMRDYDLVPIAPNPQAISIIVAGGTGAIIAGTVAELDQT
jgi:hypothetical protein